MTREHLVSVYERAARYINSGRSNFSCVAIDRVVGEFGSKERRLFARTFEISGRGYAVALEIDLQPEPRRLRVLMLLLMAEWVKTEWKKR